MDQSFYDRILAQQHHDVSGNLGEHRKGVWLVPGGDRNNKESKNHIKNVSRYDKMKYNYLEMRVSHWNIKR